MSNIGIIGTEVYIPKIYVCQEELEQFDNVSKGKYTIGLGQKEMAFVEPYEDISSISLTVVQNLLEKYQISPKQIGRLEVGTETFVDKSKSTKTVLMQLFQESGNHDIEGVTTSNACYGGTNALFNTLQWAQSPSWDRRLGIVVMADLAVYTKGSARSSGGAGAIAYLIGDNAPIIFEPIRSTFIDHVYDFYKPDISSEYPTVDGKGSINTYLGAIDNCYQTLQRKQSCQGKSPVSVEQVSFACFHAPFGKMVQKAFYRLVYYDIKNRTIKVDENVYQEIINNQYDSKIVQSHLNIIGSPLFKEKVAPTLSIGTRTGNIYTGSLYLGLVSLLENPQINLMVQQYQQQQILKGKRIMMFSYGSGLAASMFILKVVQNVQYFSQVTNTIQRLNQRIKISPQEFDQIMADREAQYGKKNLLPIVNLNRLFQGTFYLTEIDNQWRRFYKRKGKSQLLKSEPKFIHWTNNNPNNCKISPIQNVQVYEKNIPLKKLETIRNQFQQSISVDLTKKSDQNQIIWNGFYKKTIKERLDLVKRTNQDVDQDKYQDGGLSLQNAELMVENCIGKLSLPIGLGLNFRINDKYFQIPMCIEEPSVLAAASSGGKLISEKGSGFQTFSTDNIMIGQIQLLDCNPLEVSYKLENHKNDIIQRANLECQNLVKRGGGVINIHTKIINNHDKPFLKSLNNTHNNNYNVQDEMVILELQIDVCDCMGANIVNTVVENISPYIEEMTGARAALKILSNLCTNRMVLAQFSVPVEQMAYRNFSGEQVTKRILESYRFAQLDQFRATTHNKGIMNGIDAVAIALGQDWRSIEAACHSYASNKFQGKYQPLSHYEVVENERGQEQFKGTLEIPIAVGSKGGVQNSNQLYENNLKILGNPNSREIAEIMACVGLAQNFSALRALAVEGIQKGHMSLHARNIALSAGVPSHLVEDSVRFMKQNKKINQQTAKTYLEAYDLYDNLRANKPKSVQSDKNMISTFYIELALPKLNQISELLNLHIAFECGPESIHFQITKEAKETLQIQEIHQQIFGQKGYQWMEQMFISLEKVRLEVYENHLPNKKICFQLKLLVILIDLLVHNMQNLYHFSQNSKNNVKINQVLHMLQLDEFLTEQVIQQITKQNKDTDRQLHQLLDDKKIELRFGLFLLNELYKIFQYNLEQKCDSPILLEQLSEELRLIINSAIYSKKLAQNEEKSLQYYKKFWQTKQKRLCATMILLIDALNLKPLQINSEIIDILKLLGDIYEKEITLTRDLQRYQNDNLNVYKYYSEMNKTPLESELNKKQFQDEVQNNIKQLKIAVQPKLNEKLKGLCEITTSVIQEYYNQPNQQKIKSKL